MTDTERKIIEAAIGTFVRYGAKKTTMGDIAEAAGVSRQTVYDAFGNKDEVIRAGIVYVTDQYLARVQARLEDCTTLAAQIDAYFEETVVKSFELLQTAADPEELISGHNQAGKAEIARSHVRHEALVTELLAPHADMLSNMGESPASLAHLVVTAVMGFKYQATDVVDLKTLLKTLKRTILLATGTSPT
ncbi:MAG: TetR/AcrR family transcriptional regulator [Pseudomonadota bacterium]